jgi:hypothetical protein
MYICARRSKKIAHQLRRKGQLHAKLHAKPDHALDTASVPTRRASELAPRTGRGGEQNSPQKPLHGVLVPLARFENVESEWMTYNWIDFHVSRSYRLEEEQTARNPSSIENSLR